MEQQTKTYSKNAHHMIMSYDDKVYHVDSVHVNVDHGREMHSAIFHAKEVQTNAERDLQLEIPLMLCDVLIEYAKINNPDAVLVLNVKDNNFNWNVLSEAWLRQTSNAENAKQYVA